MLKNIYEDQTISSKANNQYISNIKTHSDFKRQSNIELLRIISMILIVAHHFSFHGVLKSGYESNFLPPTLTIFLAQIFQLGGKIGVELFIIITGYFLVKSKFNSKKIILLGLQVFFYSIGSLLLLKLINAPTGLIVTIKSVFPLIYGQYWFATAYIVLYLLSPFLNKLLLNLQKKKFLKMLGLMLFLWIIIPTFTKGGMGNNEITRFILFYSIGAFIRLYPSVSFQSRYIGVRLTLISYFLMVLSVATMNILGEEMNIGILASNATYFSGNSSILVLGVALGLFIWFKSIDIGSIKWINIISGATFGVYLIHDNTNFRQILWHSILQTENHISDSPILFLWYAMSSILITYVTCTIIELLRQKFFGELEKKIINYNFYRIIEKANSLALIKSIKVKFQSLGKLSD